MKQAVLLAITVSLSASPSFGDDRVAMTTSGAGSYKVAQTSEQPFDRLDFKTDGGRSFFLVWTDAGVFGFSGKTSMSPTAEDYLLQIDAMISGPDDTVSNRTSASGHCEMKRSGNVVMSLTCASSSGFGDSSLTFTGNGQYPLVSVIPRI